MLKYVDRIETFSLVPYLTDRFWTWIKWDITKNKVMQCGFIQYLRIEREVLSGAVDPDDVGTGQVPR